MLLLSPSLTFRHSEHGDLTALRVLTRDSQQRRGPIRPYNLVGRALLKVGFTTPLESTLTLEVCSLVQKRESNYNLRFYP